MEVKEILTNLGYQLILTGDSWRCNAIYRNGDNKTALKISKDGTFYDFVSGEHGNLEKLIALTLKIHPNDSAAWLKSNQYIKEEKESAKPLLKMDKIWKEEDLRYLFPDYSYFQKRKINPETLKQFQGGLCHSGQLLRRYVFSIKNEQGEIIGLSGRSVVGAEPKWKHLGKCSIRTFPYYENRLEIEKAGEVILVEGISDCLALWECGFKNSLVMFGLKLSDSLISLLIKINPRRIIIATNNDKNEVGQNAFLTIKNRLLNFFDREKIDSGVPTFYNDISEILVKEGISGVKEWYKGLEIL